MCILQVEETVQANLQRLLQPTSSIPNIGRKALKKQQSFEPKTRALLNSSSSNNSNNGSRFITRPRVVVPKRSPAVVSPDTIIEAVTNSNNIYSMNYPFGSSSGSNSNSTINNNNNHYQHHHHHHHNNNNNNNRVNGVVYDEACSDSGSIKSGGAYEVYNTHVNRTQSNRGKHFESCDSYDQDTFRSLQNAEFSYSSYNGSNNNKNSNNDNNDVIVIPGGGEYTLDQSQTDLDLESDVKDTTSRTGNKRFPSGQHPNSLPTGRKLYRTSAGHPDQSSAAHTRLPPWQNRENQNRNHPSNQGSVDASRSGSSRVESSVFSSGYNTVTNHREGRNSIDIYLPSSHPFGTPFVRNDSMFSRENTTGSEGGFTRVHTYNPSVESIQPGSRFPTINNTSCTQDQPQQRTSTTTSESRSRSNSRGEIGLSARNQKTSSLPNVRSRYMIQRRRSNSSSGGFPEEPGSRSDTFRGGARINHSQGGSRRGGGGGEGGGDRGNEEEEEEVQEETEDAEGILSSSEKRHIVIDMPSIIFNAASPDVGIDNSALTASRREMSQGQGQGSTPQSRAGGQSSSSLAATPTGWSQTSGSPAVPNLSKAMKQQEIRKRELQNLLEDVRELNIRTEVLSSQSEGGSGEGREDIGGENQER